MTLSEEQKELIRSLFKKGTYGVKCDGHIVGRTFHVNSLEGLEIAFNDTNLRTIVCYELSPYNNIQQLLSASEMHGPYVKMSGERYYLITSIYKVSDDDCRVALEGNHKGNLNFKELLNTCKWQDGTHCGVQGIDVFRWSSISGVLTMNI